MWKTTIMNARNLAYWTLAPTNSFFRVKDFYERFLWRITHRISPHFFKILNHILVFFFNLNNLKEQMFFITCKSLFCVFTLTNVKLYFICRQWVAFGIKLSFKQHLNCNFLFKTKKNSGFYIILLRLQKDQSNMTYGGSVTLIEKKCLPR